MIADGLRADGALADVRAAAGVRSLEGFDTVVVAGALYAGRWHRDARQFVRRHRDELRARTVWFASSGPLDASATEADIPPVRGVAKLMTSVGARGHATFGGRLASGATGFIAGSMAKRHSGDWRDGAEVHRWTATIAADDHELTAGAGHQLQRRPPVR
jgi:menaquinone-dependent protoporphyrinogen oxidase